MTQLGVTRTTVVKSTLLLLVLFAGWVWSSPGGSTRVRIEARGEEYALYLDGRHILTTKLDGGPPTGGVGYRQGAKRVPVIPGFQALSEISVIDLASGATLFSERFDSAVVDDATWNVRSGDWQVEDGALTARQLATLAVGGAPWRDYAVEFVVETLLEAEFMLRVQNERNYVGCTLRPFRDFDGGCHVVVDGAHMQHSSTGAPLLSPWVSARSTLRLLLQGAPLFAGAAAAVALVTLPIALAVASVVRRLGNRSSTAGRPRRRRRRWLTVACDVLGVLVAMAAFVWLLHVTDEYLERVPHVQDSAALVFQAKTLAAGRLWAVPPGMAESFALPNFVHIRDGRLFGIYPLGQPAFFAVGARFGAVWVMPAVAGALLLLLVYLLGRQQLSPPWGLLASWLVFCSPFFQMTAPNFMSHTVAAVYFAASLYALLRAERPGSRWWWPALSGAFLGLLLNTRPLNAAAVVVAYGLYFLLSLLVGPFRKKIVARYTLLALGVVPLLGLFIAYNTVVMGSPLATTYGLNAGDALGFQIDSAQLAKALLDNYTLAALFIMVALGWTGAATTAPVLALALPSPESRRGTALLCLCLACGFMAYMTYSQTSVGVMYGPRYVFEVMFVFVLLMVAGVKRYSAALELAVNRIVTKRAPAGPEVGAVAKRVVSVAAFLVLAALGANSLRRWASHEEPWPGNAFVPQNVFELKGFNRIEPTLQKAAASLQLTNAVVFVEEPDSSWWHYGSVFFENGPNFDNDVVYARDRGLTTNLYVMDLFPGRSFYQGTYVTGEIRPLGDDFSADSLLVEGASTKIARRKALAAGAERLDLGRALREGTLTVESNDPTFSLDAIFDGNPGSLAKTAGINPLVLTLRFSEPVELEAVRLLATYSSYDWELRAGADDRRLMVKGSPNGEWSAIQLDEAVAAPQLELALARVEGDDIVHFNEMELYVSR